MNTDVVWTLLRWYIGESELNENTSELILRKPTIRRKEVGHEVL